MFSHVLNYNKGIILICKYFSNICEILPYDLIVIYEACQTLHLKGWSVQI